MLEPPKNIESGHPFAGGIHSKIREILAYLERSRLIPGDGIRLVETPCGIAVSAEADRNPSRSASPRKNQAVFEYSGPWALWTYMNTINVNPGLIWTSDGAKLVSPGSCNKPSVSSMIVLDYTSGALLTTVQGDIDQWATNYTNYFNTHALLGRYDAETDSVIQYHFSPIVYLIETEDFVIEPE